MSLYKVYDTGVGFAYELDTSDDILGSGTVGEVLKVRVIRVDRELQTIKQGGSYALKRFRMREGRDDFENESMILRALEVESHKHIMGNLSEWTDSANGFMLFALADTDLSKYLDSAMPPARSRHSSSMLLRQVEGICDAIKYVHNYEASMTHASDETGSQTGRYRIGFHHDLKPANVLIFGTELDNMVWKLADFGSGTVKQVSSSDESIYNRKASTGDPAYSAPEFEVDGRVSRPKDVWSFGCICLELYVWYQTDDRHAIADFRKRRAESCACSPRPGDDDDRAKYWCTVSIGGEHRAVLNPAVQTKLSETQSERERDEFDGFACLTQKMLCLDPRRRPRAGEVCHAISRIRQRLRDPATKGPVDAGIE